MLQPKPKPNRLLPTKHNNSKAPKKIIISLLIGFISGASFSAVLIFIFTKPSSDVVSSQPLNPALNRSSNYSNQQSEDQINRKSPDQHAQQQLEATSPLTPQSTPVEATALSNLFKHSTAVPQPVETIAASPFQQIQQQQKQRSDSSNKRQQIQNQVFINTGKPNPKPHIENSNPDQPKIQNTKPNLSPPEMQHTDIKTSDSSAINNEANAAISIDNTPPVTSPVKILITVKPKEN